MSLQIVIEDHKIENMSSGAKETLKQQLNIYADEVIKEANLIEEGIRENGASREVTSNIVLQAVRKNKNYINKKNTKGLIILKVVSAISILFTGSLFDYNGYEDNPLRLFLFIIFLIAACVSMVLQFVKEGK